VLNAFSSLMGGSAKVAESLGRSSRCVEGVLHTMEVQVNPKIWWRFGGGSDRNRALLGNPGNSMHDMQIAQSRINTGECASR